MKHGSTVFLKAVIFLIGVLVLAGLLWFPQIEGRNANAGLVYIYFQDPVLAYVYLASTPFFIALSQAFRLLGYIERGKAFSQKSVNALRNMKYCAIACIGFIVGAMPFLVRMAENEDAPGVILFALVAIFAGGVIATAAGVFQSLLQSAVNLKSENDLTV